MRRAAARPTLGDVIHWLQRHGAWADALTAAVLAALVVSITALAGRDEGLDTIAYPCAAVAGGAFVVRRSRPEVTLLLTAAAITVYGATDQPGGPIYATIFLAAINLAALRPMRTWLPWTAVATAALVAASWAADGLSFHLFPAALLLLAAPKLAGARPRGAPAPGRRPARGRSCRRAADRRQRRRRPRGRRGRRLPDRAGGPDQRRPPRGPQRAR